MRVEYMFSYKNVILLVTVTTNKSVFFYDSQLQLSALLSNVHYQEINV